MDPIHFYEPHNCVCPSVCYVWSNTHVHMPTRYILYYSIIHVGSKLGVFMLVHIVLWLH